MGLSIRIVPWFLLFFTTLVSADSLIDPVDQLFSKYAKSDSPGCAVAIIKDGSVVYKQGYGMANLEYNIPITPSTIFHVASVSKQFTAFAVLLLENDGKLSLDDDIHKYLPEMHDFGMAITIRHLILHTSGLRDQWDLAMAGGWRLDDVITQEHLLKLITRQQELNFNPGDEHLYCNSGYTLLAEIVSRVSGKPFIEFTQERIFQPLNMTNTHFHIDHEMIVKNRAYSYSSADNGRYKISALNYANVGATSLFTTVEDLAKWDRNFDEAKVGGKAVLEKMLKKGVLNHGKEIDYACGLGIGEYKGLKTISHGGSDAGYRSLFKRFPDQHFSLVILSNYAAINFGIVDKIADLYLAKDLKKPDQEKKEKDAEKPEKPQERVAAQMEPSHFDALVGEYELMPKINLSVFKEENRLMIQATGQDKAEIFPESETEFFLKVTDAQLSFKRDDKGIANELILHQNGKDITGKKIEKYIPSVDELKEYLGKFYSVELVTFYTITMNKENQLTIQHQRHPDVHLTPTKKNQCSFSVMGMNIPIDFVRNEGGKVTGFLLSTGRIKNLKFDKIEIVNEK